MAQQQKRTAKQWTKQEDGVLLETIHKKHGGEKPNKWDRIAELFAVKLWVKGLLSYDAAGKDGKACRLRYMNQLNKDIYKGEAEKWEDQVIKDEIKRRGGNKFAEIAGILTQARRKSGQQGPCRRTDNMVKNRWHQKLKHEVRAEGRKRRASEDESLQAEVAEGVRNKRQKKKSAIPAIAQQGTWAPMGQPPVDAANISQFASGLGYQNDEPLQFYHHSMQPASAPASQPEAYMTSPAAKPSTPSYRSPTATAEHYAHAPYGSYTQLLQEGLHTPAAQREAYLGYGGDYQSNIFPEQPTSGQSLKAAKGYHHPHSYPEQPSRSQSPGSAGGPYQPHPFPQQLGGGQFSESAAPSVPETDFTWQKYGPQPEAQPYNVGSQTTRPYKGQHHSVAPQPEGYSGFEGYETPSPPRQMQQRRYGTDSVGLSNPASPYGTDEGFLPFVDGLFPSNAPLPASKLPQAISPEEMGYLAYQNPSPTFRGYGSHFGHCNSWTSDDVSEWNTPRFPGNNFAPAQTFQESLGSHGTDFNVGLQRKETTATSILNEALREAQEAAQNLQYQEPQFPQADSSDVLIDMDELLDFD